VPALQTQASCLPTCPTLTIRQFGRDAQ